MKHPALLMTFVEVVNRQTMAQAARYLSLTPAAVSKHILALETELGIQLLKRSTRRIELTPEGLIYLEHAKRILSAYKDAEAAISYSKEEPAGILKVVCGPEIGNRYLLPYLQEFLDLYPKLTMHLDFTQIMPNVEQEKVDVVVGLTKGLPAHCIQKTMFRSRWMFCASPHYLERYGKPQKPADLMHHKIITHTSRNPSNVIHFKNGEVLHVEPLLYCNDTRSMRTSARHGLGIVQMHDYIVEQDIKDGHLIELLAKYVDATPSIPIHISYLPASQVHIKIRKFVDFMTDVCSRTRQISK